ncbi:MAG: dTMP kinase [Ignavibacteria bacterium]|jgi:dTMP kinase|nr:dTMP kinase [Ignavibacteria bacterium]MCU7504074.1 dTMP kinase [Ignavibacteria bacterium]MCU7518257.1 dTMP kinase [Ignavibacteria bacterium]
MFITFEGIDFCGKSTQVSLLEEYLIKQGKNVKIIREPGGTIISEKIRDVLLDKKNDRMFIETEILLFSAARAQLVREIIRPFLNMNYYVISDRFHDSTTAYQGFGRAIPLEFVNNITQFAIGETVPDLTFFIDIPIEESERRMSLRKSEELDRIEVSKNGFYEKVRQGYIQLSEKEKRVIRIDGLMSIGEIHERIIREITMLEERKGAG